MPVLCSCGEWLGDGKEAIWSLYHGLAGHQVMGCGKQIGPYPCCSVVQGDCLELMKALPDGCVDAVITDPPYGVNYLGRFDSAWEPIHGDKSIAWIFPTFREVFRVLANNGAAISFYGWPDADEFVASWKRCGFRLLSHFSFIKNVWGLGFFTRGQHESAYLLGKSETRKPDEPISDVQPWTRVQDQQHPTQKPLDALEPVVEAFGGETILDPFCGSGTTLVAAKKIGRHFLGFDISEIYVRIARERIARVEAQPNLFEKKPEQLPLV